MGSRWRSLVGSTERRYDFQKLIDTRLRNETSQVEGLTHIICDIDKTYLETEFESIFKMAKIAYESAQDKITVRGASDVLIAARWGGLESPITDGPRPLHFVSSSPPQLRAILEEKLTMDGLDWNTDTFKNQAYNVLKGRMDLLRHHVAYKSAAILRIISKSPDGSKFILIGDNAESDAYIYVGISLLLAKKLSIVSYIKYLILAGVEKETASDIAKEFDRIPPSSIAQILIRRAPGYATIDIPRLTSTIAYFDDFFQTAMILIFTDIISQDRLWPLTRTFHNQYGFSSKKITSFLEHARSLAQKIGRTDLDRSIQQICQKFSQTDYESVQKQTAQPPFEFRLSDLGLYGDISEDQVLELAATWAKMLSKRP